MMADKESQMSIADELRGEVQEKINLIEEFEDKFTRQFRWEDTEVQLEERQDTKLGDTW